MAFFIPTAKSRPFNPHKDKNTSVVIASLPSDITLHELLGSIRNCGRVKASNIDFPASPSDTAVATITFFRHVAAKRLVAQNQIFLSGFSSCGRPYSCFSVRACPVGWSTGAFRTREEVGDVDKADTSRVLRVAGPADMVSRTKLMGFLMANLVFDIDDVVDVWGPGLPRAKGRVGGGTPTAEDSDASSDDGNMSDGNNSLDGLLAGNYYDGCDGSACLEVRFGAWRNQARTAKIVLDQQYGDRFEVWYGEDPCGA